MYFRPNGSVTACCFNRSYELGHYPGNTIKEIWQGARTISLSNYLQKNDFSHGCERCKVSWDSENLMGAGFSLYERHPINKNYPTLLEFELNNTCNLECVMCFGEFSSSIRRNRDKLPALEMKYDDKFVTQLEEFIPYLKEAKFLGGEPFLIKIYYKIWEKIIEINPDCVIDIQTNATILNSGIKDLLERGRFRIGVSIDSQTKEIYEKIRVNSNYEIVKSNLEYL
jgi:MoaA/NifB/PqqE/SkfB family radical SAM enzyme